MAAAGDRPLPGNRVPMRAATLHRVLGALLLGIAAVFAVHHLGWLSEPDLPTGALLLVVSAIKV